MVDSMSKKERLARGSAVIKVMKVIPRPGHFLKTYVDPYKLPRKPKAALKGMLAEMPHLDVKNAFFELSPVSARVPIQQADVGGKGDPCAVEDDSKDVSTLGLPDGDKVLDWYGYRRWSWEINPQSDGNIGEHFNIMLGLLISMAKDPENQDFADCEAYPCVQFLRTIKAPDGSAPYNTASFIFYIEYVCQKMIDEG